MRIRPETLLIVVMAVFALTGLYALNATEDTGVDPAPAPVDGVTIVDGVTVSNRAARVRPSARAEAMAWFRTLRPYCNPVLVESRLRSQPAPDSEDGLMYEAACYALAGDMEQARTSIERLPPPLRYRAAGVVFETGHPAADAGDEAAAGPLMELVVEYWPNHYMALYHAGAARYERGDLEAAHGYLTRFLEAYEPDDGWRANARSMLASIEG